MTFASLNNLAPGMEEFDALYHVSVDVLLPDDLDGLVPGPVPGSHVPVALSDGSGDGEVPDLAVHLAGKELHLSQMILSGFLSLNSSTGTICKELSADDTVFLEGSLALHDI